MIQFFLPVTPNEVLNNFDWLRNIAQVNQFRWPLEKVVLENYVPWTLLFSLYFIKMRVLIYRGLENSKLTKDEKNACRKVKAENVIGWYCWLIINCQWFFHVFIDKKRCQLMQLTWHTLKMPLITHHETFKLWWIQVTCQHSEFSTS